MGLMGLRELSMVLRVHGSDGTEGAVHGTDGAVHGTDGTEGPRY